MMRGDVFDEEIVESDVELDDSDVVEPDYDPPAEVGDPSVDVTDEKKKSAQELKSIAMDELLEGKLDEAINQLTEAIIMNPKSAMLYASRASVFVKLKKPNAAIRDANAALEINPDLVKGLKARGLGRALLGLWEEAVKDLDAAAKLDFDEETSLMLKKVKQNAIKIEVHREKYERIWSEKELKKLQWLAEAEECASMLNDGKVILIKSGDELDAKMDAASKISRLSIVYFTATWCGPCHYIGPVYTRLAAKHPKVVFFKVDIDETVQVAADWSINSIPIFFVLKDGEIVDEVVDCNVKSLDDKIAEHDFERF